MNPCIWALHIDTYIIYLILGKVYLNKNRTEVKTVLMLVIFITSSQMPVTASCQKPDATERLYT